MKREKIIKVRLSETEYDRLIRLQKGAGISNTSAFVRRRILNSNSEISSLDKAYIYDSLQAIKERHLNNESTQNDVNSIFDTIKRW